MCECWWIDKKVGGVKMGVATTLQRVINGPCSTQLVATFIFCYLFESIHMITHLPVTSLTLLRSLL